MSIEKRICKSCNIEKDLQESFYFHKNRGYWMTVCRNCQNEKRRKKWADTLAEFGVGKINKIGQPKTCIYCKITKELNIENFHKSSDGRYKCYCRECWEKNKLKLKEIRDNRTRKYSTALGYEKIDQELINGRIKAYRLTDFNKGRETNISYEFLEDALHQPCTYCGYPSTGLDRIDNNVGHIEENCIPCCRDCNVARANTFSVEEMMEIGAAIKGIKDRWRADL